MEIIFHTLKVEDLEKNNFLMGLKSGVVIGVNPINWLVNIYVTHRKGGRRKRLKTTVGELYIYMPTLRKKEKA